MSRARDLSRLSNPTNFTADGTLLAVGHSSSPYITVYKWDSGFGTKYSDPSTLPGGTVWGAEFTPVT